MSLHVLPAHSSNYPPSDYDQATHRRTTHTLRSQWSRFVADHDEDVDIFHLQVAEYEARPDRSTDVADMFSMWILALQCHTSADTDEIDAVIQELIEKYYSLPSAEYAELESTLTLIANSDDIDGLQILAQCLLGIY